MSLQRKNPGQKKLKKKKFFLINYVNIFQKNDIAGQTIIKAIELNIKYIWTQLNIFNFEAANKALKSNHVVIMNRCTKIEHSELIKRKT